MDDNNNALNNVKTAIGFIQKMLTFAREARAMQEEAMRAPQNVIGVSLVYVFREPGAPDMCVRSAAMAVDEHGVTGVFAGMDAVTDKLMAEVGATEIGECVNPECSEHGKPVAIHVADTGPDMADIDAPAADPADTHAPTHASERAPLRNERKSRLH